MIFALHAAVHGVACMVWSRLAVNFAAAPLVAIALAGQCSIIVLPFISYERLIVLTVVIQVAPRY